MPAIETLPLVLSPTGDPATFATKKNTATGDEFEQAMTDALAPDGKISAENTKSKLNFLTTAKRPFGQSGLASTAPQSAPQMLPTEQSAGNKIGSPDTTAKTAAPSSKAEKTADASPALLIPSVETMLAPMISFSPSAPGNFFVTAAPTPAPGGKTAALPLEPALTGVAAKLGASSVAAGQKVSPEISSLTPPRVKLADLMAAPSAQASEISTPVSALASTAISTPVTIPTTLPAAAQIAAPLATPTNIPVGSTKNFAAAPAAISNPQPGLEPVSPGTQTQAPALEILASDSAVAVPLNFQAVAGALVTTPQPENFPAPKVVATDPQKSRGQSSPVIQTATRKTEPVGANSDGAHSANIQTNIQVASLPEKNLVGVVIPTAADESAPKMSSGDLPSEVVGRGELRADGSNQMSAPVVNTGTGVASTLSAMKKSDKVEFFAGLAGQKLPVAGPTRVASEAASSLLAELPPRRSELFSSEFSAPFTGLGTANNFTATTSSPAASVAALPSLSDARLQTVERTHDLVSVHALRLVESKSDSMSVVLKPGAGMELSLELRQRDGVVEAQAFLSSGDHQLLNQHWADLQARLEMRGVKLGPLGGEESFTSGGNFSQQQSPARDEETERAAAFAEFAAVSGGATARSAAGAWGWESWA